MNDVRAMRLALCTTVSIRIVADCGTQIFQFRMKFECATTHEFTTVSAIIFSIHVKAVP